MIARNEEKLSLLDNKSSKALVRTFVGCNTLPNRPELRPAA
jgi:hypothetical protein